ncbi:Fic family protein [Flavobacterium sp. 14A]|uniref:Fic family protein n=1 Tax=Flavobacterium sp. 14A TaxID=2735896 RepID=UPI00156E41AE|nr:Fic family protein [Flavobacterium sp. 14A]NRT12070.1 Fic family protein [Flavobacterium sp. 14A]
MKNMLRTARENKGLKTRELSKMVAIDQALISKFESGERRPTKNQLLKLAITLDIELAPLLISWLKEKIINEIANEDYAIEALKEAQQIILSKIALKKKSSLFLFEKEIQLIEHLKKTANALHAFSNSKLQEDLALTYLYESNRLDGNSLSKIETELILNEGQSIAGKSMHEHLDVINHQEAMQYTQKIIDTNTNLTVAAILELHQLLYRGITPKEAGSFRTTEITVKNNLFSPSTAKNIATDLDDLLLWLNDNVDHLHPLILVATFKIKFVTLQPFKQGTAKIARLLMNVILVKNTMTPIIIKSDADSKNTYMNSLIASMQEEKNANFTHFIIQQQEDSLRYCISFLQAVN